MTIAEQGIIASIHTFLASWNEECESTEKLFNVIPQNIWYKEVIPGYRTLARLAWHIVQSPGEMLERAGLPIQGPSQQDPIPTSGQEILQAHRQVWKSVVDQIGSNWTDQTLDEVDDMYGQRWTRSRTLTALLHHLIHHRGQMTVLCRVAGIQPPGIYGPVQEEWAQWGMPPPAI